MAVDDTVDTFICVDELQKMGVNVADIAKLKAAGLSTVRSAGRRGRFHVIEGAESARF